MSRFVVGGGAMVALLLASLYPTGIVAQLPTPTPAQEEAGARVTSAAFDPVDLELHRGDTALVRITLLDADGSPVSGAMAFVFTQGAFGNGGGPLPPGGMPFTGTQPGEGQAIVLVRVADADGNFQGVTGIKQVGMLAATVLDWPVARIDIEAPDYRPYVGTSFKLRATPITTRETVHGTAAISWRSEDPAVASITPGGVVSFSRSGAVTLVAANEGGITARHAIEVVDNPVQRLEISPRTATTQTGDVFHFNVQPLDGRGRMVDDIALAYSVFGLDSAGAEMHADGAFVAENPGAYRVVVSSAGLASEAIVEVDPRAKATPVQTVGRGALSHVATSDLWVFEGQDGRDYAYTGTHSRGGGERMFVWDVTDPAAIALVDSVVVDARVVNDVKVNADGTWAIITREGASNRRNGIVVLDLADPAHPVILSELTDSLTAGIHNVWINGDVVYAINDGTSAMNILDLSDPAQPRHAGRWELRPGDTDKSLHDVWADGGYAYLSYWDDGLVILDVGAGTHGGTPTEPAYVSRIAYEQGNTHVAWRERNYVFVGDEIFGCPECTNGPRGYIHVIDVSDIASPQEVARYEVPEAGAHNIWVENGVLYIAYYQGGLRIVDVSGELRGDLYRQGREIGWIPTSGAAGEAITPNSPMAWGPQPHKGHIFISDMNSGLWAVKHARPQRLTP